MTTTLVPEQIQFQATPSYYSPVLERLIVQQPSSLDELQQLSSPVS